MRDFDIREYNAEDIPALSRLWEKTFEDSPALIADFFRLLPDMGTGLAAVQNGEIVGAWSCFAEKQSLFPADISTPWRWKSAAGAWESAPP